MFDLMSLISSIVLNLWFISSLFYFTFLLKFDNAITRKAKNIIAIMNNLYSSFIGGGISKDINSPIINKE
ncbi:hypothetical protein COU56_01745 [Candidatus Pacearchaeota archaeon CG10_big_fil_rev_8_21_14_0_10_31_9]|nr:MAG: hypothetical protein COU56_01745 [Candidatus Pacearchaeota archaeon CG10_big_fil_rev_8_21_14_0_10_31_9]